jgi:hypothetical protein
MFYRYNREVRTVAGRDVARVPYIQRTARSSEIRTTENFTKKIRGNSTSNSEFSNMDRWLLTSYSCKH